VGSEELAIRGTARGIAYSLDGACTNQAESFLARLRRMVDEQHHHVSLRYSSTSLAMTAIASRSRWASPIISERFRSNPLMVFWYGSAIYERAIRYCWE
jgi:hypothetical protein